MYGLGVLDDGDCIHGIPAFSCSLCLGRGSGLVVKAEGQVVLARYNGWCTGCDRAIEVDDEIVMAEQRWVHVRCA